MGGEDLGGFILLDIWIRVKFSEVVTMSEDKGLMRKKQKLEVGDGQA